MRHCCEIISNESFFVVVKKKPGAFRIDRNLPPRNAGCHRIFVHPVNPPQDRQAGDAHLDGGIGCVLVQCEKLEVFQPGQNLVLFSFLPHHALRLSVFCEKTRRFLKKPSSSSAQKHIWMVVSLIFVLFTPKTWGRFSPILRSHIHIFEKGLVNQPPTRNPQKTSTNVVGSVTLIRWRDHHRGSR